MERAQNLLTQSEQAQSRGDTDLAIVRAQEGMKVLRQIARANPEYGALLVAAEHGYNAIEVRERVVTEGYELIDRKFMGFTLGTDVVPTRTSKDSTRIIRLTNI